MSKNGRRGPNWFLRMLNRLFCRIWHRLPKGEHGLPDGPVILVGNHICGVDPLLVQASVNRPLCFLMAREYYTGMSYLKHFFDAIGVIPVNPGGANRHALEEAIEVVRQGNALCLFPEGEANPVIPLHRILPGAIVIAMESGAPIIPFRVSGVWPFDHVHIWKQFLVRNRARVVFGEPLCLPESVSGKGTVRAGVEAMAKALRHVPKGRSL
ncbi:MAG: lysophospholipid acyltransferase family protein [Mariprofundaceae bacterium]